MNPHITCLCPTYKRPDHLANAVACFEAQTHQNKSLIIVDDAAQHPGQAGKDWVLYSDTNRYPDLPSKFNAMGQIAQAGATDILAVWEDDDVYLPGHLAAIAAAYDGREAFFAPDRAWSTYERPFGETIVESAHGRFHASWAYTVGLWQQLGGYPPTTRLDFDQQMHGLAAKAAGGLVTRYDVGDPTYVYRWGNGLWHGSQRGEDGYAGLWAELDIQVVPPVPRLVPRYDEETILIHKYTA